MSKKQKTHAVRAKRSKPQGVDGKPTMVATFKKKAMFNPEVNNILETLEKEALEVGAQRAMQQLGQGIKSSASELSDMQKKMNRQEGTMKGLNAAALGAGIGGGAALLALRHRKKKQEAAKKAEKAMEKKASFNPEVDRILDNLEKKASLRGVGVAAKRMMGPSGRKMMRSGMANPVRTAAAAGATLGAVRGAVKPGTNEDGTKKSRLSGMARGAAAGGVLGAGAGYGASKIK